MREVNLKWFRQAYLEERPDHVFTEFMTEDGQRYQTFSLPFGIENLTNDDLFGVIDSQTDNPVICNA